MSRVSWPTFVVVESPWNARFVSNSLLWWNILCIEIIQQLYWSNFSCMCVLWVQKKTEDQKRGLLVCWWLWRNELWVILCIRLRASDSYCWTFDRSFDTRHCWNIGTGIALSKVSAYVSLSVVLFFPHFRMTICKLFFTFFLIYSNLCFFLVIFPIKNDRRVGPAPFFWLSLRASVAMADEWCVCPKLASCESYKAIEGVGHLGPGSSLRKNMVGPHNWMV